MWLPRLEGKHPEIHGARARLNPALNRQIFVRVAPALNVPSISSWKELGAASGVQRRDANQSVLTSRGEMHLEREGVSHLRRREISFTALDRLSLLFFSQTAV